MAEYPQLFSAGRIGGMTVKNRLLMAPMVRNYADAEGRVTPKYRAHVESIARGGVGALILEASYISPEGKGFVNELGIHDDACIPGLRELADIAHQSGARIGVQLYHAGRQTASAISGLPPVAPSAIPDPTINEVPVELSVEEIHRIVDAYAQGARRAQAAGCDFVEVHGAHGYLITQFLSPFSNARTDDYGGSFEHRLRFMGEVIEAVRAQVGTDFAVILRLSGDELVPGGLTLQDTVEIALRAEALRVDALHITAGNYASYERGLMIQPMAIADGPLVPLAQTVRAAVKIPVITVGKIRTPELAEAILEQGQADFVALGRPLLADANWPVKAREGRAEEINKCIACNQGCISRLFEQLDVWCTVNPATAREQEFVPPAQWQRQRVAVIGGGPAGMEAAKVAAERGHAVTLYEETDHLGGQLIAAAAAPYRPGWEELRQFQMREMERLGIDVRLNTPVTPEMARTLGADLAIVAIGSHPVRLKIPGVETANVITARDLLEGKAEAMGRVIVAGGGCAGAQTAEYLAEKGYPVSIVEMLDDIAIDAPRAERELLLQRLLALGVEFQLHAKIMRVEEGAVIVERVTGEDRVPGDTVVVCLGSRPNDGLAGVLREASIPTEVVGDAVKARKVTDAMVDGALAALAPESPGQMKAA